MSISNTRIINCPECKIKNSVMIWSTVNADVNPEAREMLLQGNINTLKCSCCGKEFFIDARLLYHDMKNQFCVWYFPFKQINDIGFFSQFTDQAQYKVDLASNEDVEDYFNSIHCVFEIDEMVRYILFREKLAQIRSSSKELG